MREPRFYLTYEPYMRILAKQKNGCVRRKPDAATRFIDRAFYAVALIGAACWLAAVVLT